jgi:hypothetical protein
MGGEAFGWFSQVLSCVKDGKGVKWRAEKKHMEAGEQVHILSASPSAMDIP